MYCFMCRLWVLVFALAQALPVIRLDGVVRDAAASRGAEPAQTPLAPLPMTHLEDRTSADLAADGAAGPALAPRQRHAAEHRRRRGRRRHVRRRSEGALDAPGARGGP